MQLPAGDSARNEEKMTQLLPGTRRRSEGGEKGEAAEGRRVKVKEKYGCGVFKKLPYLIARTPRRTAGANLYARLLRCV